MCLKQSYFNVVALSCERGFSKDPSSIKDSGSIRTNNLRSLTLRKSLPKTPPLNVSGGSTLVGLRGIGRTTLRGKLCAH